MEDNHKRIMQPKTIKSKNKGCGTAPGNLVYIYIHSLLNSDKENMGSFKGSHGCSLFTKISSLFTNIFSNLLSTFTYFEILFEYISS